ncbi:MAG: hypothetical protein HN348_15090 [Proteobacteria bacterium]|jgi:hypothetical protein|nr:hypothetical protein [Pseudomonadota bacterium]
MTRTLLQITVLSVLSLASVLSLPRLWCGREANALYEGDEEIQYQMARGLEYWIAQDLNGDVYSTGSPTIDGEWWFATYMMGAMGFGQTALEHPEWRAHHVELMEKCLDHLVSEEVRAFDTTRWGGDAFEALGGPNAHVAYLGYLNLPLSLHRLLDPNSKYADLNDEITAHLVRLMDESDIGLLKTYPYEIYPIDNTAFVGSLGLYDRATGQDHSAFVARFSETLNQRYRDAESGLLVQTATLKGRKGEPRGSGTAFAAYFMSFADPEFSASLYESMRDELIDHRLGWGVVREYPRGVFGLGDIDSGPVILGYAVSTTGMTLAVSRAHGDRKTYADVYATAYLFGAPHVAEGRRHFATGGPVGDALMFALLTAQPVEDATEVAQRF